MRCAAAWAIVLAAWCGPLAATSQVDVVVHPAQESAALQREQLRAIFMMRLRTWPDGTPIRVFVLRDDDPLHDDFVRQRLGTFPYVLRGMWDRMVYTGTGLAPTVVGTEAELRERVRSTPGAVGYGRRNGRQDPHGDR
jgi:hypothetical protein